jgi:branched-chain amino acid transport system ATP-binding protein
VRNLDLTALPGKIIALIGPNGAGETATLDTVAGVLSPLDGTIGLFGKEAKDVGAAAHAGLAYLPESRGLFRQLTVRENLRLRTHSRRDADQELARCDVLAKLADRRTGRLCGGEQQVLALACALAAKPRLLLIDEMTMGSHPSSLLSSAGSSARQPNAVRQSCS